MDPFDHHLRILAEHGDQLTDRLRFSSWTASDTQVAAVLRFLNRQDRADHPRQIVGIVGGSSSGKSTIFNNLIGADHVSHVTMKARTTKGLILATPYELEPVLRRCLDQDRVLFPRLEAAYPARDGPVEGDGRRVTVVPVRTCGADGTVLLDTPDYSTERSRREGDDTLRLLPWFDRVLIVVDPQRWYDHKTFADLREHLDRFGIERRLLFNCNEEGRRIDDAGRQRLAEQAALLDSSSHELIEYRAGRGFLRLPEEALSPTRSWLARSPNQLRTDRRARLRRLIAGEARQVLNQNTERRRQLAELHSALVGIWSDSRITRDQVLVNVLLSPEERKLVSPVWQAFGRSYEEARRLWGRARKHLPLAGRVVATAEVPEPYDRQAAGREYFADRRRDAVDQMWSKVRTSRFFDEIGRPAELNPREALTATTDGEPDRLTGDWQQVVETFQAAIDKILPTLRAHSQQAAIGAGAGAAICALLAVPTGGVSVGAGALYGLLSGGLMLPLGRTTLRILELRNSPQMQRLQETIEVYLRELDDQIYEARRGLLLRLGDYVLDSPSELYFALMALADAGEEVQPEGPQPAVTGSSA